MPRDWEPPNRRQRRQLAEIKRRTGMRIPEELTYGYAAEIIDASPVFAAERRARRAAGRRKGFAKRDAERRRGKAA